MRCEPLPPDLRWYCDLCKREQWHARPFPPVSLCYLCLAEAAERPDRAHHLAGRIFVLERELEAAKRTIALMKRKRDEV